MAFWNNWRDKPAPALEPEPTPTPEPNPKPETKSVTLGVSESLGNFLMFGNGATATTPTSALSIYEKSTAVSVPINKIADPFSVMDLALNVDGEVVRDHPVLDLLKKPSPFCSRELFLEILMKDYLITGEFSVIALGNANYPPTQIQAISPKNLTPVRTTFGDVPGIWQVSGETLTGQYIATPNLAAPVVRYMHGPYNELKHVRNYSTRDNSLLRGQSLLVSAAKEARQHILGTTHNIALLENGGRISLVFHFEEDMDLDDLEEIDRKIQAKHGGATRAGSIGVSAGGKMEVKELGINPKDLDFANLQKLASKSIAMQYGVPLPLISDERMTQNNFETAVLALYDDAVLPNSKRVLGGLSDLLLPRYKMDPRKVQIIADQESVTALVMRRNEELKVRQSIGVETANELRAQMGREAYDGGDVHYINASMIPVGTDLWTEDNDVSKLEATLGGAGKQDGRARARTRTDDEDVE